MGFFKIELGFSSTFFCSIATGFGNSGFLALDLALPILLRALPILDPDLPLYWVLFLADWLSSFEFLELALSSFFYFDIFSSIFWLTLLPIFLESSKRSSLVSRLFTCLFLFSSSSPVISPYAFWSISF